MSKKNVIYYIDGLNLYQGLKQLQLRKYYWIDYVKLATNLLTNSEKIKNKIFYLYRNEKT